VSVQTAENSRLHLMKDDVVAAVGVRQGKSLYKMNASYLTRSVIEGVFSLCS